MTQAEIEKSSLPSSEVLCFDALHVPANRRSTRRCWYDVFAIANERFVVSIGSVDGGAAEAAAALRAVREACDPNAGMSGSEMLLSAAEAVFCGKAVPAAVLTTATVGIVDCAAGTFTYVSAGGPPPFIRYDHGAVAGLPSDGQTIGRAAHGHSPAAIVVDLRDAAFLLLYSGTLVQMTQDTAGGLHQLRDILGDERMRHCSNPAAWIARRMLGNRSHDNAALLTLTFPRREHVSEPATPAAAGDVPRWSVSWSFDATGSASTGARRAFLACLSSKKAGGKAIDVAAAELIFGELLGNVVRHAPGLVEITLDWTAELPVLHVLDNGPGFQSRRSRERLPADDWSESGRGLFIINACATQFSLRNRAGRGTHASATLPQE